jgi:hypothetical protein
MTRKVSPPRDQLRQLRQPLTEGEREVFDYFDQLLRPEWEIYVQPHLNGLRPDFVLLHPLVGIVVVEVKDWNLDAMGYQVVKEDDGAPRLYGIRDGKRFSLDAENPFNKIALYREEILNLYCPSFQNDPQNSLRVVAGLVIFTRANRSKVEQAFDKCIRYYGLDQHPDGTPNPKRNNCCIGGCDDMANRNWDSLRQLIEFASVRDRWGMSEEIAADLRHWLEEPEFSAEQRRDLPLDAKQKDLATTRTASGYRRIKGPAGSGKSQVLAARASQVILGNPDARVLVISFNITLLNYLQDLAVRWPHPGLSNVRCQADWLNFHAWCKRLCLTVGARDQYSRLWKGHLDGKDENADVDEQVYDREISNLVAGVIDQGGPAIRCFDAILVDEGQDLRPEWWACLRKVLKDGGEMLLVADASQDIYGRNDLWTEKAMEGCGFAGDWVRLTGSHRIPAPLAPLVGDFARRYVDSTKADPPSEQTDFLDALEGTCTLRWREVSAGCVAEAGFAEALRVAGFENPEPVPFPDVTIVVSSRRMGRRIVSLLEAKKIRSIHTFDTQSDKPDSRVERRKKLAFYKGDARVKVTTIHSFKGLETRALVICHSHEDRGKAWAELLYTAMTRLKRSDRGSHLTVVTDDLTLADHGRLWPDFAEDRGPFPSLTIPPVHEVDDFQF